MHALFIRGIQLSIADIVQNRSCEQARVLQNNAEGAAQIPFFNFIDIDSVVTDFAVCDIVESVEQVGDGCLSCAGGADKGNFLPGFRIKRDVMQDWLMRFICKIHVRHPYVPGQFGVGYGSVCPVGMFPGPHSGPFSAFHDFSVLFPRIDQCNISIVGFGRFIQQGKNPFRSCKAHDNGIDLMGHLIDVSGKLLRHIQKRNDNADTEGKAGKTEVGCMKEQEASAHKGNNDIQHVAHIIEDWPQGVGIFVGGFGFGKEQIIDPVKIRLAFLFVAENLHNFLSVHDLFHIAFFLSNDILLPEEMPCGIATDFFCDQEHQRNSCQHDKGQPCAKIDHDRKDRNYSYSGDQKLWKALGNHLTERIDVIGIVAHDITVIVGIKIANR